MAGVECGSGYDSNSGSDKSIADEMKHAYAFAERVDLLGGDLTAGLHPIKVGGNLEKKIRHDLQV